MKSLWISLILIIVSNYMYSQNSITISGTIYDNTDGNTLGGVHIYPNEFATGTFTEDDGIFELQLPYILKNDTLVISCIGYLTKKILISEISSNEIYLNRSETMLTEVGVVSEYQAKRIIQKACKHIRNNFPYKESYSAKANFREYTKLNDETILFLELFLSIKDKGWAYKPESSSVEIEDVFSLIRNDSDFDDWAKSYYWQWVIKGYLEQKKREKEKYIVDSISFIETDKVIYITYIPPVKREDTVECGAMGIYDLELDSIVTYYDSTMQYNTRVHYAINMTNYAILNYSISSIRFSKLNINSGYKGESILTDWQINISFKKKGNKYFPERISSKRKMDVYQNKKFDKVVYKAEIFRELLVTEINEKLIDDKFTSGKYEFFKNFEGLDEFEGNYSHLIGKDTILECFDDNIRKYYLERIGEARERRNLHMH